MIENDKVIYSRQHFNVEIFIRFYRNNEIFQQHTYYSVLSQNFLFFVSGDFSGGYLVACHDYFLMTLIMTKTMMLRNKNSNVKIKESRPED
jgi:hypothetical protein